MEQAELLKAAETCAFVEKEIGRLLKEAGESGETVRRRNREYIAEHPFGSVYGDSDALVRENEKTIEAAEKQRAEARLLEQVRLSPYFGRVDFTFADDGETEAVYVGMKTLVENRRFLVYDWRAPISALYYYGELGPASYAAPCGSVDGEIRMLRQYTFKNGELQTYWDADLHIDDAVLRGVLSGQAAQEMRPIVYTIQREQNAAIRYAPRKNLAVFGPAGSGKTAVGLHRLAWLLYQAQNGGDPVSTLMVTANEAFRSYVSAVLPSLGEANTQSVGFAELFARYLPEYRVEPALRQTEALLQNDTFRVKNVASLYAPEFADFMDAQMQSVPARFKNVNVLDQPALSAQTLEARFRGLPVSVPVQKRLQTLADWAADELENYFLIHRKELLQTLLDRTELGESYTQRYLQLRKRVPEEARRMVLTAVPDDPAPLLKRLFSEFYGQTPLLSALMARIRARELYFEDACALLFIAARLGKCPVTFSPTHVLVDEAQDLAPLQHRILRTLYPRAVFTALADTNQSIAPAANTCSEAEIAALYGAEALYLGKSYRSTRQIGEFAKRYLPEGAADYEVFDRAGPVPETHVAADPVKITAELMRSAAGRHGTVCVLLPTAAEAAAFYKKLKALVRECALLQNETQTLSGKLLCMPATLAKGLEFDCVLLPLPEPRPSERLMYLMATRALHELHLIVPPGKE